MEETGCHFVQSAVTLEPGSLAKLLLVQVNIERPQAYFLDKIDKLPRYTQNCTVFILYVCYFIFKINKEAIICLYNIFKQNVLLVNS